MRLNKFLAHAGVSSRREADKLIKNAMVTVNGIVLDNPAYQVQEQDEVIFNNQKLRPAAESVVIKFNKPPNVITTASDPQNRPTVFNYIKHDKRLFPVGRLDRDSTGLLLITNDGELANLLMHPKHRIPRIYLVSIDKPFQRWEITRLNKGIYMGQNEKGRAEVIEQVTVKKRTTVKLRLHQGKKHEVRRLMMRLKRKLFSLQRIEFGPIRLGDLPEGKWVKLSASELKDLAKIKR
ncbi:MAG: pseudouridine synthase [Candidatus Neomarinimicrobiota bacterium]